jgi:hypothetical protein
VVLVNSMSLQAMLSHFVKLKLKHKIRFELFNLEKDKIIKITKLASNG